MISFHTTKSPVYSVLNQVRHQYSTLSDHDQKLKNRFKIPSDFIAPDCSSSISILSKPTWDPPCWRLTGVVVKNESVESLLQELEESKVHIVSFRNCFSCRSSLRPAEIESSSVYYRNILTKIIWLDDQYRIENRPSLHEPQAQKLRTQLKCFLENVKVFIDENSESLTKGKCYGQLTRIFAAVKFRLSNAEIGLTAQEKASLQEMLTEFRRKAVMHLVPSATIKLAEIDIEQIKNLKKATLEDRYKHIDLIVPLNIGMNTQELTEFVSLLHQSIQNELRPLIDLRNQLATNDSIWNQLVDKALDTREKLRLSLESIEENACRDLKYFEAHPTFGRILLKHGRHFSDDLFINSYIMKIIDLDAFFRSPHTAILLEEQQLNRQIFAAKDQVKQSEKDPNLLLIQTHLNNKHRWIHINEVPFVDVYIPDEFQRLLSLENRRFFNNDDSCQTKENVLYYLPKKGLIKHDPHHIPENINDLVPFDVSQLQDSFTPAISYGTENSTITRTHAFSEIHFDNKRYIIGKFFSLVHTYSKVDTYWKFFRNAVLGVLSPQPSVTLSPDQNSGYPDRLIATLNTPLALTTEQKQKIFDILDQFRISHGACDGEVQRVCQFMGHTYNCTGLTEEMLKAAGVDLPCIAPLHALLKINHPSLAGPSNWISTHPNIANPFLKVIGWLLGAKGKNQLTAETLERIMTPYIPRLYVVLKNSTDPWRDQIKNNKQSMAKE